MWNDFQFCNLLNCVWFAENIYWVLPSMCVFVLRATFSKKCVWLICNVYGGLQQIKTVIKIVCKPTISINLKNQTGALDRSRNLSTAWMTQKNKSGNILKHLTAQKFNSQLLEPHFLNKFNYCPLSRSPQDGLARYHS